MGEITIRQAQVLIRDKRHHESEQRKREKRKEKSEIEKRNRS
jgi:hypothetical protein